MTAIETAKEEIAQQLIAIAPEIGGKERMQIGVNVGASFPTITNYFSGKVKKLHLGKKILDEAKKMVA